MARGPRSYRSLPIRTRLERLDTRVLPAVATWDGGAGTMNWADGANWVGDSQPNVGDDVTIDRPEALTISIPGNAAVSVGSLTCAEGLTLLPGATLMLTAGASSVGSPFVATNATLSVVGSATFTATGTTTADGASFLASAGGAIALPNLTSYTATSRYPTWRATGVGSALDLRNVTAVAVGAAGDAYLGTWAEAGSAIDLRSLTAVTVPDGSWRGMGVVADGAGSVYNLSALTTFTDPSESGHFSYLVAINHGTLLTPALTAVSASVTLDGTGVMPVGQIASLTGGYLALTNGTRDFAGLTDASRSTITVNGTAVSLPALAKADGAAFAVRGGVTLAAPALTSYAAASWNPTWTATGPGSVLDLRNVAALAVGTAGGTYLGVRADAGGSVDLRSVPAVAVADGSWYGMGVAADGPGSVIDLSALTSFTDPSESGHFSYLTAVNGGSLQTLLLTVAAVSITLDATGVMPTAQLQSVTAGYLTLTGGTRDFAGLTDATRSTITVNGTAATLPTLTKADGTAFVVSGGVTLAVPALTSYAAASWNPTWTATGPGSVLDLRNVATLTVGATGGTYLGVRADAGGFVDLRALSAVAVADGSWYGMGVAADGAGSVVDLTALATFTDPSESGHFSYLTAVNGATLLTPALTAAGVSITLDATGVMPVGQLASLTAGYLTLTGGSRDFAALTDASRSTITVNGTAVTLSALAKADGAAFRVSGGVTLAAPALTTYAAATWNPTWTATGPNSVLDLRNLATLTVGATGGTYLGVRADAGGSVDLRSVPAVAVADGSWYGMGVAADGPGSVIDLSALTSFTDPSESGHFSYLTAVSGGTLLTPALTKAAVSITLDATGVMPTAQLQSVTAGFLTLTGGTRAFTALTDASRSTITVNGAAVSLPALATANGAAFRVSGGVTLAAPGLTSYVSSSWNPTWTATGPDSVLDLRNVTAITAGSAGGTYLGIRADAGGRVDLRAVAAVTVTDGSWYGVGVAADGPGSVVDFTSLAAFTDPSESGHFSYLTATNGGALQTPALTQLGVSVTLDATGVMPVGQLASLTGGYLTLTGGTRDFAGLTDAPRSTITVNGTVTTLPALAKADGAAFVVSGGVTLAVPALTAYSAASYNPHWFAVGTGSVLDLRNLTTLTVGDAGGTYLEARALAGGRVDLSGVTGVAVAGGSWFGMAVVADGLGSVLDATALATFTDPSDSGFYSYLVAQNSGVLKLGSVGPTGVRAMVIVDGTSVIQAANLTTQLGGLVTGTGTISGALSAGSAVEPGGTGFGTLTVTNGLTLGGGAILREQIAGVGLADRVAVTGPVVIAGAKLVVDVAASVPLGTAFTIISNDGSDAVVGTFADLPQGATVGTTANGLVLVIDYHGGDGNDVAVVALPVSIVVEAGAAQRSQVRTVTVSFAQPVTLGAGAFTVTGVSGAGVPLTGLIATGVLDATGTRATVTFSGPGVVNGSLPDGSFTFTVNGAAITVTATGAALDADGDGVAGGTRSLDFIRYLADFDGDGAVDGNDLAVFATAFNSVDGDANYRSWLDLDGDGAVDGNDLAILAQRFNTVL